jgi:CheY-like chemotaxis protein
MDRILVVDNDPAARRLMRAILTSGGHTVDVAENGVVAMDLFWENRPDLIVLDILMPVMNGRELFQRLERQGMRPPVIVVSSYEAERERRELRAERSLEKPFDPDDLLTCVEDLLAAPGRPAIDYSGNRSR